MTANSEKAYKAVEWLWQLTVKTRALCPSTDIDNIHPGVEVEAIVSPSWYQERGATYFVKPMRPFTKSDLLQLNNIAKFVNQNFIILMSSILEGFELIPEKGPVDKSKKWWEYAQFTKWLRNQFAHGEFDTNPSEDDLWKALETHNLLICLFPKASASDQRFPTSIDSILEPLKDKVLLYIKEFDSPRT